MDEKTPRYTDDLAVQEAKPQLQKPQLYKVIVLNDDYTPMEFVVIVLERFFYKNREQATQIMLHVHMKGLGVCGVYTHEVAETKVSAVHRMAEQRGYPLRSGLEKE